MSMVISGTSGVTFPDATTQSTSAGVPTISAGSNYYGLKGGEPAAGGGTSYIKRNQYRVLVAGTYRMLAYNSAPWGPSCGVNNIIRFYKNGVAVSGEYSTALSSFTLVTYDITLAVGDLIQLYSRNSFGSGYSNQGDFIGIGLSANNITANLMATSPMPYFNVAYA